MNQESEKFLTDLRQQYLREHNEMHDRLVSHSLKGFNVVVERIRTSNSSCGVSDQQSVDSSPGLDTCVLKGTRFLGPVELVFEKHL